MKHFGTLGVFKKFRSMIIAHDLLSAQDSLSYFRILLTKLIKT